MLLTKDVQYGTIFTSIASYFQLRACQGAVLLFKSGMGNGETNAVEVYLGKDVAFTEITFRDDGGANPITCSIQTPYALSCDSYR